MGMLYININLYIDIYATFHGIKNIQIKTNLILSHNRIYPGDHIRLLYH